MVRALSLALLVLFWCVGAKATDLYFAEVHGQVQVLTRDGKERRATVRRGKLALIAGELALVPARDGQTFRIRGSRVRVGHAFGTPENAVVFGEPPGPQHFVHVPRALSVRALAIAVDDDQVVELAELTQAEQGMAALRFREAADAWLRGKGEKPAPIDDVSARFLDLVVDVAGPTPLPLLRAWASTALDEAYSAQQGVGAPWYPRQGSAELRVAPDAPRRVFARKGDVVSLLVRPRLAGPTALRIIEDDETLLAREAYTGWERIDASGLAAVARLRRMVANGPITLESEDGEFVVGVRRYRRARTLGELFRRDVDAERAGPLVPYVDGSFDRASPFLNLPPDMRAAASLLALEQAHSADEVSRFATPLLRLRTGSGQSRVAALLDLLRVDASPEPEACAYERTAALSELHTAVDQALDDLCGRTEGSIARGVRAFDALATRFPADGIYLRIARELARREGRTLEEPLGDGLSGTLFLRAPSDGRKDGQCRTMGRARLLSPGAHVLHVEGDRPRILSLRAVSTRSSKVDVGVFSLSVQGGGAMASRVRVPAGDLALVLHDEPVLVEFSQDGLAPCEGLRDAHLAYAMDVPRTLSLGDRAGAVLAFEFEAASDAPVRGTAQLRAGSATFDVLLLGRARRARIRVLGSERTPTLTLTASPGLFARAFLDLSRRRYRDPEVRASPPLRSEAQWITALTDASHRVFARAPDAPDLEALAQRAEALVALGYSRLAEYDYVRLARHGVFPREREGERLGPLNVPAKLPPLSEAQLRTLGEALRLDERGEVEAAARLFESLGVPLATGRAASLRAELSWAQNDAELALSAYSAAVAVRGPVPRDEPELGLSRLESAVRFAQPATLDTSAGSFVERVDANSAEESRRHAIGRAFLVAPDDAQVLREDEGLTVRLTLKEAQRFRFEGACRALADEPCELIASVDGRILQGSVLQLGPGSHDLELKPSTRALAWLRFCDAREDACSPIALTPELSRRWFAATPDDPARLSLTGPTVVRLTLRTWKKPARVRVRAGATTHELVIAPAASADEATTLDLAVTEPASTLEVEALEGTVYLRPAVAEPLIAARRSLAAPSRDKVRESLPVAPLLRLETPQGRTARRAGFLSVWAHQRWVPSQIADLDGIAQGSPFFETSARLLTTLPGKLRLSLGVLSRQRAAADSYGFTGRLDLGSHHWAMPRIILSSRVTGQYLPPWSWGTRTRASGYWTLALPRWPLIMPWGAYQHRTSPRYAARRDEVDPDVYSNFAYQHDRSTFFGVSAYYRPLLDLSIAHNTFFMTNRDLITLDRAGTELHVNVLPGRGLVPWVNLGYGVSHRFPDRHRPVAFWRQVVELDAQSWLWVSGRQRLALSGNVARILDVERWVGMIQLSWMFSPGRGVLDLTADEVEYRERMQEGALLGDDLFGVSPRLGAPR